MDSAQAAAAGGSMSLKALPASAPCRGRCGLLSGSTAGLRHVRPAVWEYSRPATCARGRAPSAPGLCPMRARSRTCAPAVACGGRPGARPIHSMCPCHQIF
eukprot:365140-Chlamydomonas_euryale.AAC.6